MTDERRSRVRQWRERRRGREDDWLPSYPGAPARERATRGWVRTTVRKTGAIVAWAFLVIASGLGMAGVIIGIVIAVIVTINGSLP